MRPFHRPDLPVLEDGWPATHGAFGRLRPGVVSLDYDQSQALRLLPILKAPDSLSPKDLLDRAAPGHRLGLPGLEAGELVVLERYPDDSDKAGQVRWLVIEAAPPMKGLAPSVIHAPCLAQTVRGHRPGLVVPLPEWQPHGLSGWIREEQQAALAQGRAYISLVRDDEVEGFAPVSPLWQRALDLAARRPNSGSGRLDHCSMPQKTTEADLAWAVERLPALFQALPHYTLLHYDLSDLREAMAAGQDVHRDLFGDGCLLQTHVDLELWSADREDLRSDLDRFAGFGAPERRQIVRHVLEAETAPETPSI